MSQTITYSGRDFTAAVIEHEDGTATLWWTDHVVNEWTEPHDGTALAMLRLAALIAASDTAGDEDPLFFTMDAPDFDRAGRDFLATQLS